MSNSIEQKKSSEIHPCQCPILLSNHLRYLDSDALLLWHSFSQRGTDNCIWYPLKSSYTSVSARLCILTVVIISLSAIFAINLSWRDNLRQFYLRCFREPLLSRVARRCASVEETRGRCIQCSSLSTLHRLLTADIRTERAFQVLFIVSPNYTWQVEGKIAWLMNKVIPYM